MVSFVESEGFMLEEKYKLTQGHENKVTTHEMNCACNADFLQIWVEL